MTAFGDVTSQLPATNPIGLFHGNQSQREPESKKIYGSLTDKTFEQANFKIKKIRTYLAIVQTFGMYSTHAFMRNAKIKRY